MKRKILGVDPGTKCTGWGIIATDGRQYELVEYGTIEPKASLDSAQKYLLIFEGIEEVLQKHGPLALSVETQYVHKNIQSAIKLGMARGVVVVAGAKYGIPVFEYAPAKAKQAITGNGSASKEQILKMIKLLLNLKEVPSSEDAADALALAITHAHFSTRLLCMNL